MARGVLLALTALLLAVSLACGDDDDATPSPTPDLGLGGSLPRHLTAVSPANGATLTNAELGAGEGACASFTFAVGGETMGDDPTSSVRLFVQGEDFTDSADFQVTASQPPTNGTICYSPEEPLPAGPVLMTVRYSEATGREFVYNWQFTLSE